MYVYILGQRKKSYIDFLAPVPGFNFWGSKKYDCHLGVKKSMTSNCYYYFKWATHPMKKGNMTPKLNSSAQIGSSRFYIWLRSDNSGEQKMPV